MGFYLELKPIQTGAQSNEFIEQAPPSTYWLLFLIAVFAMVCMTLAAYPVLGGLLLQGSSWDWLLFLTLFLIVGLFLFVGFKMAFMRKFIRFKKTFLETGYYLGGIPLVSKRWSRTEINEVILFNHRPAPNLAPQTHQDPQYYIRGHWRLLAKLKCGKNFVLDKHVEQEALQILFSALQKWMLSDATE